MIKNCIRIAFMLFWTGVAVPARDLYMVNVIYPQVGQQGTRVEVIAEGGFLENPLDVLFYQPGIECVVS
ncbi:MAG: hypothetical protein AAF492_26895 [Verrucomicrobiota bacterium]